MIRLFRSPAGSLALGIVVALSLQQPALAATVDVKIGTNGYTPESSKARLGDTVLWTNSSGTHTVSNHGCPRSTGEGPGLFCSPEFGSGTFSVDFQAAGNYTYFCQIHSHMQGTIAVAMKAKPSSGTATTEFTITWAKGSVPTGFDSDVQIQRPGASEFSEWMINQTGEQVSSKFVPDGGPGVYKFRSRLQKSKGALGASGYSAPRSITVS